jgi:Tfp pilus assembly protein PilX
MRSGKFTRAQLTLDRKQAVTTHAQQLEEIEARLRETEQRLQQAKSSPPRPGANQHRNPTENAFANRAQGTSGDYKSPLTMRRKPQANTHTAKDASGACPDTPTSDTSTDRFVLVDRPGTAQTEEEDRA